MISFKNVTKRYGNVVALDYISFDVSAGRVCGFVGPNGAGKSTAMRCLTGLAQPTSGQAFIFGKRYADLPNPGRFVGVMLDASSLHPGRTGREILAEGAYVMGMPASRIDEVLELVRLTSDEAGRRVKTYSLGMKQRLGIAHALLGKPQVLILDEPANGLDPAGIRWMRDLLRSFADGGGAVLLSSHLLHEVQLIADDLAIIGHGRVVAHGPLEELMASQQESSLEDFFLAETAEVAR